MKERPNEINSIVKNWPKVAAVRRVSMGKGLNIPKSKFDIS